MEDQEIVQLIWDRQEHGLRELSTKYNGYCYSVSYRIVHDAEDARECVNDTWLKIWKRSRRSGRGHCGAFWRRSSVIFL